MDSLMTASTGCPKARRRHTAEDGIRLFIGNLDAEFLGGIS